MAEQLHLQATSREERYQELYPQLQSLTCRETNLIANLANAAAALRQAFGFFWVGFYLVEGDELVLGPFQGDIACTRIARGRGVCGASWLTGKTLPWAYRLLLRITLRDRRTAERYRRRDRGRLGYR